MKVRVLFFLLIIGSLGSPSLLAQEKYELKFSNTTLKKKFSKFISIDTSIALTANKSIRSLGNSLIDKGYFLFTLEPKFSHFGPNWPNMTRSGQPQNVPELRKTNEFLGFA